MSLMTYVPYSNVKPVANLNAKVKRLIKKTKKWGTHPTQITKYDIQKQIKERELKESSLDILNGKPIGKEAKNETNELS